MIEVFLQVLIGGVMLGGLYALVAFGLSLTYGVVHILDFAHGTLLAVIGVIASLLYLAGLNPLWIALILVPCAFAYGGAFYFTLLRPLGARRPFESTVGTVLVTVGALLILSDVTSVLAGATPKNIPTRLGVYLIGDVVIPRMQLAILLATALLTLAIHLVLTRTWFGRAIRAVTQEQVAAQLCGVRSVWLRTMTFAFGAGTVAIAAVLYVLTYPVDPYMGFGLTVKAFTIIILGGIGNLPGALVAGILLGVAEGMTGLYWDTQWAPAISVVLLLVILVVRPQGFSRKTA